MPLRSVQSVFLVPGYPTQREKRVDGADSALDVPKIGWMS